MIIVASILVGGGVLASGWLVADALTRIARAFAPADETAFVPLEELLKEQYPEQFSNEPSDFILEEDFSLLD